jgi:hypothetical protein
MLHMDQYGLATVTEWAVVVYVALGCIHRQAEIQSTVNGRVVRICSGTVCNACSLLRIAIAVLLAGHVRACAFEVYSHWAAHKAFVMELAVPAFVPETGLDVQRM